MGSFFAIVIDSDSQNQQNLITCHISTKKIHFVISRIAGSARTRIYLGQWSTADDSADFFWHGFWLHSIILTFREFDVKRYVFLWENQFWLRFWSFLTNFQPNSTVESVDRLSSAEQVTAELRNSARTMWHEYEKGFPDRQCDRNVFCHRDDPALQHSRHEPDARSSNGDIGEARRRWARDGQFATEP